MKRPARSSSTQGLLLVEAVLSAVVIATGLVFVTRGLSTPLHALRTLEEQRVVRALALRKLLELETGCRLARPVAPHRDGTFPAPYDGYQWTMAASPYDSATPETLKIPLSEVTVTVHHLGGSSAPARLFAIWPSEWVASE